MPTLPSADAIHTSEDFYGDNNLMHAIGVVMTEVKYPATSSNVANLNRQMRDLEVRYHRTRINLEKATQKTEQVQKEIRKIRNDNQQLEKELHKKKGLLERLSIEKKQIEAQAIVNRDYAKRIEQKLAMGSKGHATATKHNELAARIKDLETQLQTQREISYTKETQYSDAMAKISILKRSLEIRIREIGLEGNIHNGMIYEIARLQEVNSSLSLQLAHEADNVTELKDCIKRKEDDMATLEKQRIDAESLLAERERELADAKEEGLVKQREIDELADEKRMLMIYVQDQAEKLLKAESLIKKLQTTNQQTVDTLKLQLEAKEERVVEATTALASHHTAYDKLHQAYNITQDALAHERSGMEALRKVIEEKKFAFDQLHHELETVQHESQEWQLRANDLENKVSFLETDTAGYQDTIRSLQTKLSDAERKVSENDKNAKALEVAMTQASSNLDLLTKERNEVARAMNEAIAISATTLDDKHALEIQVESQSNQIDQLKQSKQLLQNAMLEQLAAIRKQLQMERIGRLTAEGKLKNTERVTTEEDFSLVDLAKQN